MRILFFILFTSLAFSQSFITELADKTVGKFLYDKNIEIETDSLNIYVRVNAKGYCYALDVLNIDKSKPNLSEKNLKKLIGEDLEWIDNDSIIEESLVFDEYKFCDNMLTLTGGLNSRYDRYLKHTKINDIKFIISRSNYGYSIFSEPINTDFLTEDDSSKSIPNEWITLKSLDKAYLLLNSDEVKNKGIELKKVQDDLIKSENEMKAIPISSIDLPYKIRFGMTESDVEKHFMTLFGNFKKNIEEEFTYKESFKKGIYKEVEYDVKDGVTLLRVKLKLLHNKIFYISYAHLDKYFSNIVELDARVEEKILLIQENYYLLFDTDIYIYEQGENSIWSIDENLKFEKEDEELRQSIYQAEKNRENRIGKKM